MKTSQMKASATLSKIVGISHHAFLVTEKIGCDFSNVLAIDEPFRIVAVSEFQVTETAKRDEVTE